LNPCLLLPVYIEGDMRLWGSNLIVEFLMKSQDVRMARTPNAGSPGRAVRGSAVGALVADGMMVRLYDSRILLVEEVSIKIRKPTSRARDRAKTATPAFDPTLPMT
jgi:hypothetical protein